MGMINWDLEKLYQKYRGGDSDFYNEMLRQLDNEEIVKNSELDSEQIRYIKEDIKWLDTFSWYFSEPITDVEDAWSYGCENMYFELKEKMIETLFMKRQENYIFGE